jgi:hypothetical protein
MSGACCDARIEGCTDEEISTSRRDRLCSLIKIYEIKTYLQNSLFVFKF